MSFRTLKRRRLAALGALFLAVATLAMPVPARALSGIQEYMTMLEQLYLNRGWAPPGNQFSVPTLDRAGDVSNNPFNPTFAAAGTGTDNCHPSDAQLNNWIGCPGAAGIGNHAEERVLRNLATLWQRFGPGSVVSLFTYNSPCTRCADIVANVARTKPFSEAGLFELGFTRRYPGLTDAEFAQTIETLTAAGYRVVNITSGRIWEPQ